MEESSTYDADVVDAHVDREAGQEDPPSGSAFEERAARRRDVQRLQILEIDPAEARRYSQIGDDCDRRRWEEVSTRRSTSWWALQLRLERTIHLMIGGDEDESELARVTIEAKGGARTGSSEMRRLEIWVTGSALRALP